MKPSLKVCFCFLLAFGLTGVTQAQDFSLSFSGPDQLVGDVGATVGADLTGTMTPGEGLEGDGAQGWSLSISSTNCVITGASTAGTVAADVNDDPPGARNTGFENTELTPAKNEAPGAGDCAGRGNAGAVSAVVMSFTMPIVLDPVEPSDVIVVSIETVIPEGEPETCPGTCSVEYVDGCQGSGQPVNNRVTWRGNTRVPETSGHTIELCVTPPNKPDCPQPGQVCLGMTADASNSESEDVLTFDPDGPDGDDPESGKADLPVGVTAGNMGSASVTANISSLELDSGVQGWSLSLSVVGGTIEDAGVVGTVAGDVNDDPPGARNTGFESTEIIDPDKDPDTGPLSGLGPQGPGVVSAVVLSFTMPITLQTSGTASVLSVVIGSDGPVEEEQVCELIWVDGLQGPGQPVNNVSTIAGNTTPFEACQNAKVTFIPVFEDLFFRGDANDDNNVDIADSVYIINAAFRGGPAITCPDAADANGDGERGDVSDALFIVNYRFRGGEPPPPPFNEDACEPDPDGDPDPGSCPLPTACP